MKKIFLTLVAVVSMTIAANAAEYTADESAIDALIENCSEISPVDLSAALPVASPVSASISADKKPVAAFLLCTFLGGFGVHRHYMGTAKFMWAAYTFTFGGIFGIVPFVDWIMLIIGLVDEDITPYIANRKFFMWG